MYSNKETPPPVFLLQARAFTIRHIGPETLPIGPIIILVSN